MSSTPIVAAVLAAGPMVLALTAPAAAQQAAQTVTTIELVTWSPGSPDIKFSETCTVSGESVRCAGTFAIAAISGSGEFSGTVRGNNTWTGIALSRGTSSDASCRYSYESRANIVIELRPDGTHRTVATGGRTEYSPATGPCAPHMPKSTTEAQAVTTGGTWRILGVGEAPAGVAQPAVPATPTTTVLITSDGRTIVINLEDLKSGKLAIEGMDLARQFEIKPPSDGASYTLQAWRYGGARRNDLPVYEPMRRLDEVMAEGAYDAGSSALSCAQSAASWAKANPGKASLMALGLAVSIAMPYTAAFQASAGGMTFLESAGIGFMTTGTPVAVQTLVTSAISGEGFWKSTGKAALYGTIAGVESLVSTTVGAGVTGAVETGAALTRKLVGARVSEEAVKGFGAVASGIAGSATDYGVGILHDQAADAIAQSAAKKKIPDQVPPARSTPSGGIVLPILAPPVAR